MEDFEFAWGKSNAWFRFTIADEIFANRIYEKFFKVEDGDTVLDLGASVGPFPYSIRNVNVKDLYCLEPSLEEFTTLCANAEKMSFPVTCINKGISSKSGTDVFEIWGNYEGTKQQYEMGEAESLSFKDLIAEHKIEKIDFLKTDCEGGEYDVFNIENFSWINANVKKIAGEFHLKTPELKDKFRKFRNLYLNTFTNYEVLAVDGTNIKWDLFNEHFVQYYTEIIIYIDNRQTNQ